MGFAVEELEMIQTIRDLCGDQGVDPYEALESYNEVVNKFC